MNENTYNEYEELKRVESVLAGFEQIENGEFEDGKTLLKELRTKYGL